MLEFHLLPLASDESAGRSAKQKTLRNETLGRAQESARSHH
jgi:hypothetical protein